MKRTSRRTFMTASGMAVAGIALVPNVLTRRSGKIYDGKKLNVALLGLGNYAGILADGLQQSQYCRLAGVVTGHPQKAEAWKKKYHLPDKNIYNYDNFDSIARNPDIDLVYVVVPNSMHKEYTIRAAKAGKHVICEKPMAISAKECAEMIDACKKANRL